ncbi:NAD(P)-dependent oxidoreductase [Bordetella genomosp. 12]|uniref:3-beta hydroxysteroid dehydrogenase n=1 Tax=Bordetella genomosp. 12 TaxID=463035 RepID=A0A261VU88_9BORD|nr:NAD(P)-dependent oxidoreductase [Bordetella genomosp. 12]OZI77052.1 3-beta hydroxysteroid dehydrogenase [Bordetella genomosp. 12]
MKVALIGISGRVGTRVADELLRRGHEVTGIARQVAGVAPRQGLTVVPGDASAPAALAPLLAGHAAVISAGRFVSMEADALLAAVRQARVPRLLVVGGAGSLEVAPGQALIDTPQFPAAYKPEASAGLRFLQALRAQEAVDWTFLSPAALFEPGARTGRFRLGGDALMADAQGNSRISMEDYAIALVDELETPRHSRRRFSVAY